jgi:hypothetical protein
MAGDFVRRSEKDKSEGGRASPVAVDVTGVKKGEQGRESNGRERVRERSSERGVFLREKDRE